MVEPDTPYVLILGPPRTGSKLYLEFLNRHTDIAVVPELHFLVPRFIRRDFRSHVAERFGLPLSPDRLDGFLDFLSSGELEGSFWRLMAAAHASGPSAEKFEAFRTHLRALLAGGPADLPHIFRAVLAAYAAAEGKPRAGAKFPVNVAFAHTITEWFPEARILHLVRHPAAVLASMIQKDRRRPASPPARLLSPASRLAYVTHQFRHSLSLHRARGADPRYRLCRFEDLVRDPERHTRELWRFLEQSGPAPSFLPNVTDSSYDGSVRRGWDLQALDRWRSVLPAPLAGAVRWTTRGAMRAFGYTDATQG